jgi:hypothetical protein
MWTSWLWSSRRPFPFYTEGMLVWVYILETNTALLRDIFALIIGAVPKALDDSHTTTVMLTHRSAPSLTNLWPSCIN